MNLAYYWATVALFLLAGITLAVVNSVWADSLKAFGRKLWISAGHRLIVLAGIAMILTGSALIAGPGEPLLTQAAREFQATEPGQTARHGLSYFLYGRIDQIKAEPETAADRYPSWWHWLSASLAWLAVMIYAPWAGARSLARVFREKASGWLHQRKIDKR